MEFKEIKNKIKVLGILKEEHRSTYDFPKKQKLFEIIRKILTKLNFEEDLWIREFRKHLSLSNKKSTPNKEDNINNKYYKEKIINFSNQNYSVDIIFFSKKVTLIFNYKKDKQQKISEIIGEFILE